nr:hypothetical protein [Tanacetum cinerariifolium]
MDEQQHTPPSTEASVVVFRFVKMSGLDQHKIDTTDRVCHIKARSKVEENGVDSNLVQIGFRPVLFHFLSFFVYICCVIGLRFLFKIICWIIHHTFTLKQLINQERPDPEVCLRP